MLLVFLFTISFGVVAGAGLWALCLAVAAYMNAVFVSGTSLSDQTWSAVRNREWIDRSIFIAAIIGGAIGAIPAFIYFG